MPDFNISKFYQNEEIFKEGGKDTVIRLTRKNDFLQKAFKLQQALLNLG